MDVAIFEPAVGRDGRPHHDEVVEIARAFVEAGASATVHTHRSIDETVAARFTRVGALVAPTFTYHDLSPRLDQNSDVDVWRQVIRSTTEDLAALPECDLAFWPALLPTQVQALGRVPRGRLIVAGLDGQIATRTSYSVDIFAEGARVAARLGARLRLGVYERQLRDVYRPFFPDAELLKLPVPFRGTARQRREGGKLRIGIVGAMRQERGGQLLPALIAGLLERDLSAVVQSSFQRLQELPEHPDLEVLDYVEDFPGLVARCDLILWPSDPVRYRYRSSGVGWVAIACGVPLVMPSMCLPGHIAAEHGAACFFHRFDAEFILRAVDRALSDYSRLSELAATRAETWNRKEGPDLLARAILAMT